MREYREHMEGKRCCAFTQADAAGVFGVPVRTYEAWEREKDPREPAAVVRVMVLGKIARSYRVRVRKAYI